ncbi:response regulator [Phenylobacterium sp.]|uniref:response regulator n=1 Tax=Phenylobacterium sp. TaxID=1871053 RepID=UPI00122AA529|nr:response regulator [Phenylobacterium sp.]THD52531.1 MAG: response regulator [Phenylobacterium sp.]
MAQLRILIVEDEPIIADLLGDLLGALGHQVCGTAATEAEAVAVALRCEPDLMVVDSSLGEGSGVAAVDEILRHRRIRHIFATANPSGVRDQRPDAIVLQKPYFEADLVAAMDRAMGLASGAAA